MIKFDFWYGDTLETIDGAAWLYFYPSNGEYRGNLVKDGKFVGDFTATDSAEIEKVFPHIFDD